QFGMFFFTLYIKLCFGAAIFTTLFLGGWYGPSFLPPALWFVVKYMSIILLMILIRGSFGRFRIDQLLRFGWGTLLVLGFVNIFIVVAIVDPTIFITFVEAILSWI
ncbi:MAG: NADH-quinone oxidoreductase subunit H, partial [Candidatus Ranarchaeia archaeon]